MNAFIGKVDEPCKRCGSYTMEFREKGPHIGQYCKCCGRFVRWVAGSEARSFARRLANIDLEFESWLKMVTEIVEAEDNGQNA